MRKIYIQIDEEWLERLAAIAKRERRDPRRQATYVLEYGIAQMERDLGLVDNQQPPRIIDGVWSNKVGESNEWGRESKLIVSLLGMSHNPENTNRDAMESDPQRAAVAV